MSEMICVTNRKQCCEDFLTRVERIVSAHPHGIILREKDLSEKEYEVLAHEVHEICAEHGVPLILNGHLNLASRMGLGVQIGFDVWGKENVPTPFGVSVHAAGEAAQLWNCDASWIIAGHIWETNCKAGLPGRGTAFLKDVVQASQIPVYAIGGVTPQRMPEIQKTGAAGACVMSMLMTCDDPVAYLKRFHTCEIG